MATDTLRADAERNRQRIMEAARDAFAERGLDITLDDIAAVAGVGVGTVYRRFANKEALIDSLFEETVAGVAAAADAALAMDDPWDAMVWFFEYRVQMESNDRGLHQVLSQSTYGKDRTARAKEEIVPRVEALVRRAQETGQLRADLESRDIAIMWLMLGAASELTGPVAPEGWRRYLTLMLDGLRTSRSAPTPLPEPVLTHDEFEQALRLRGRCAR